MARFGVQTTLVDIGDLDKVKLALASSPAVLLVETLSNPHLRLADLPALAEMCRAHRVRFVVDNTFATPVLCRPLEVGADVVMESLTKMIGGHGDVTLGLLAGRGDLLPELTQTASIWGLSSNPFDCWLTDRGLDTLALRMRAASANATILADWLAEQPGVARAVYPTRPDHPDCELAIRLMCFDLAGGREAVNAFLRRAPGVPFSPSLGNTTTTCSHPATTSHRYTAPAERQRQGITDGLIRLSVGIEDTDAIKAALAAGLA